MISKKKKRELKDKLSGYSVKELKEMIIKLTPLEKAPFKYIMERDNHNCRFCGRKDDLEVHHITPKALGGDNHEFNLITLCHWCHLFLHSNPMSKINRSELVKSQRIKINGNTFSKKGKSWGRKPLKNSVKEEIIKLHKRGLSIREIEKIVYYWDNNNNKKFVSTGTIHTVIHSQSFPPQTSPNGDFSKEKGHNISLKVNSEEFPQISSNDETSPNNNIKRITN